MLAPIEHVSFIALGPVRVKTPREGGVMSGHYAETMGGGIVVTCAFSGVTVPPFVG
jgi:hypothetical protein